MLYIGIDLGTSAVKLLLMDSQGNICNIVSREYPLYFPHPGWSEQNPQDWYEQTMEGIRELLKDADKNQVAGISFGGQMHGLVILDEKDQVIRPAILWNDGRTTEECDYLNNVIGKDKLSEYTANISFTGFTAPKILWVKKNEPENFARIKKIMLPKDYIAYRLTGVHCTDVSDASGMLLFDVKNRCWSKEMCEICGVREEQLATCYESYEKVGCVLPEVADELGLPHNVVVAAGAGDNAAAAVGTGTVGDNMCNISLGTSGTIFISSDHFGVDQNNALHSFAHADGHYHLMGCMLSAASCNKWWMDEIIGTKDYAAEQAQISKLGENHVYFLPYLMGERSPHNDPNARGTFIGMTMDTSRADMTQAWIEDVNEARNMLVRGRETAEQIDILGDDGVPLDYHLIFWKSELIDFVILQQDAFDNIDGSTSMARQQYMLNMVLDVVRSDFDFDSFEEVNPYFKRIINAFKQMNYSEFQSGHFKKFEAEVKDIINERKK